MGEEDQLEDIELINEIMEIREEIDEIQPGKAERLLALRDKNKGRCVAPGMDGCANISFRKRKYPRLSRRSRTWLQGRIGRRRRALQSDSSTWRE